MNAETVLLVDDDQAEILELDIVLKERMGSDDDARLSRGDGGQPLLALASLVATREPERFDAQGPEPTSQAALVLFGQQLGRRHQGRLTPSLQRLQGRERGDHGLARAHVALQESLHRPGLSQVPADLRDHPLLGGGERERQTRRAAAGADAHRPPGPAPRSRVAPAASDAD